MGRRPFKIIGHTADIRLRVFGGTLEELFCNALLGMASIQKRMAHNKSRITPVTRRISIESADRNALLVDFLNEAIALSDAHNELYPDVAFSAFSETALSGELRGLSCKKFDEDVKAATHHGLDIKTAPEGYTATIVFDV